MMSEQLSYSIPSPVIYIVDDDEAVRIALTLLVEAYGWHAESFPSATAFLVSNPISQALPAPACLLLDLHLPGMNGAELQEHLRQNGLAIPAIVLTARPDSSLAQRARAAGALKVVGKPFDAPDLIQDIKQALDGGIPS